MSDAVVGQEVDGYRIEAVLGRGGMGTVYRAEDVNLSRTVAIKRINPGQQEREAFIHRFRSEAQALARIDSPRIVSVHALRETDIGLLIVMEYVQGGTLKDPIDQQGAIAPEQAVPILEQVLQAFHDAHGAGVIHRDIKPENVMLTQDGMVKVTDFGIAKLRQPDSGETVTQGGQGGTLKYMSPEQISSIDDVDARSDLYSIGMTAYQMLAGRLPFRETDTDFDIMRKVVEGEVPPPDEINPDIPSGLAQWIVRATRTQQADRYQSAEEMLAALREADQQADVTKTQPEWEVTGGSPPDETQTALPPGDDETQTASGGGVEDDPDGQTVLNPDTAAGDAPPAGATQPSVPQPPADTTESASSGAVEAEGGDESADGAGEGRTRSVLVWGVAAVLVVLVGGIWAYTRMGGGGTADPAALTVTTTPAGAMVLVNGDTAGTTPLRRRAVEAGPVRLRIRKEGARPLDTTLTAETGQVLTLRNVALPERLPATADDEGPASGPQSGTETDGRTGPDPSPSERAQTSDAQASTQTTPPSATDEPDVGEEKGQADPPRGIVAVRAEPSGTVRIGNQQKPDGGRFRLRPGPHTVTCEHPDHGTVDTTVTASADQTEQLTCYFEQTVHVTARGPWGQIWVDGRNTGKQTPDRVRLGPGQHRIGLRTNRATSIQVGGGVARTQIGDKNRETSFSGNTYTITVEPSFTRVEHALSFNTVTN